jgi:type II secretory pathway pseudopilin PulG
MKSVIKQSNKKTAFTIVELLVVMSIIMILMGVLLPAFNAAKRYARKVKQTAQFQSIDAGLELYLGEFEGYPNSDPNDENGDLYCGAMKLAEAMMGQDLLGFHPDSHFNCDDEDPADPRWPDGYYPDPFDPENNDDHLDNLRARVGPYVTVETANAYRLRELYANAVALLCDEERYVLCDVYPRVRNRDTGRKVGMPILYYEANVSNILHDVTQPHLSIYDYRDNHRLVQLGAPWDPGVVHPLWQLPDEAIGEVFYEITRDEKVSAIPRPKMVDSYILISAGYDGLYGTKDDVFNFGD